MHPLCPINDALREPRAAVQQAAELALPLCAQPELSHGESESEVVKPLMRFFTFGMLAS
jgi:hypothetical protein